MNTRLFSRHLPVKPVYPTCAVEWFVLAWLGAGLVALTYYHPLPVIGFLLFVTIGGWIGNRLDIRRKRALAASRPGDALCSFARAIELRSLDPWVVRATFEELQQYLPKQVRPFPIQPADRLVDLLRIDPEDIDDIGRDIAARAGYSLAEIGQNPLCGKVETVGDIIQFFTHQPKIRGA